VDQAHPGNQAWFWARPGGQRTRPHPGQRGRAVPRRGQRAL